MDLVSALGSAIRNPIELLQTIAKISVYVQLDIQDGAAVLSSNQLIAFTRDRDAKKDELLIRVTLRLFLLVLDRQDPGYRMSDDLIQLIYGLMSDPLPEVYSLLLYATRSMTAILMKTTLQFSSKRLQDTSSQPTMHMATLLLLTRTISNTLGKDGGADAAVERFSEQYLQTVSFPLTSWERVLIQTCLGSQVQNSHTRQELHSEEQVFQNLETLYHSTVEFLQLYYKANTNDHKALGALEIFIHSIDQGKMQGIFASLEVSQSAMWIIDHMIHVARRLAYVFGESSKGIILRILYLLIVSFPDYTGLIYQSAFSVTSITKYEMYVQPRATLADIRSVGAHEQHDQKAGPTDEDLHEALLQVITTSCTSLLEQFVELVALAFTTVHSSGVPAVVPIYWDIVPINRRSAASAQNIRAVVTRLLVAEDTGMWIGDWLRDTTDVSIIFGHVPLMCMQIADRDAFVTLYDSVCTHYQKQNKLLDTGNGAIVASNLCFYDAFILILSTLAVKEVSSFANAVLMENQTVSKILSLSDWQEVSLSYNSMDVSLLRFVDLAYDRDVFKPIIEVTKPCNGQASKLFIEDADFLPALIDATIAVLDDVAAIISCVDDGEFYQTAVYRYALSCLYYYDILHAVFADDDGDFRIPVTKETRHLVAKALFLFKGANHMAVYYAIIKLKMTILRLLSMASVISGLATMFVAVAPTAAVHVLLALFYSCSLLETMYTSPAAKTLEIKVRGDFSDGTGGSPGVFNVGGRNGQEGRDGTIVLKTTMVYALCTAKELYYTLVSTNEAIRGGMLKILILELSVISGVCTVDKSFLTAIHTAKYRNLMRNSINMLVINEEIVINPWEKHRAEENLCSLTYVKQAINLYDEERAKGALDTTMILSEGLSFSGLHAEIQLTAIHHTFTAHSKAALVASMRSFVKDGLSFGLCLQALGYSQAVVEFLLAEPVLRYGILCAAAGVSRDKDSFDNNGLLALLCDSLTYMRKSDGFKLLSLNVSEHRPVVDILALLEDFLSFIQKNYTSDGFTPMTAQTLKVYDAALNICIANGLTAETSQAIKLCFSMNKTGILTLLPKIHAKLSSKAKPEDLVDVCENNVTSRCVIYFVAIFCTLTHVFQQSPNLHKATQEHANLSADLIARLLGCITKVSLHSGSNKPMTQSLAIAAFNLMNELIIPFTRVEDTLPGIGGCRDKLLGTAKNCMRMADRQNLGAFPLNSLFGYIECPSMIVTEEHMQTYMCYVFIMMYCSFANFMLQRSGREGANLLLKAMLTTALHLQNSSRRWSPANYFFVHIALLISQLCRVAMERFGTLPRDEVDVQRANCLATNQLIDGLLSQSLSILADMRENDGSFPETYTVLQKKVFLPFSILSKGYMSCVLILLQRRNPAFALKNRHIEHLAHIMYFLYRRVDSKTMTLSGDEYTTVVTPLANQHADKDKTPAPPVDQLLTLADMLYCFLTGCEGGSVFIARFFASPADMGAPAFSRSGAILELNSYGYTLLFGLISKVPYVVVQEAASEAPRSWRYMHRLLYVAHLIVLRHMQYENLAATTRHEFVLTFVTYLVKHFDSIFTAIRPTNAIEIQTQFMFLELMITLLNMYPSPAGAYFNFLPPEIGAFYPQLLDFVNGLASLYYTTKDSAIVRSNEDGHMLLYASTLASILMCPQLMTNVVLSKCNQCSGTLRQYLAKNKTLFGQSGVDVSMLSFICLARNCIDDRSDLKGDIFPAILSQMCRSVFRMHS